MNNKVKTSIFGIPTAYEDFIVTNITFKKNLNINVNGRVPIHDGTYYKSSDVIVMMDHDFIEREFTIKYIEFSDIIIQIGGLAASLTPILAALAPMFIILYLSTLSEVIMDKNKNIFKKEILKVYYEFKDVLHDSFFLDESNNLEIQTFTAKQKVMIDNFFSKTPRHL